MIKNPNTPSNTYPRLKRGRFEPETICLFLNKEEYIVVESQDKNYPIGFVGMGNGDRLEDYDGQVTIQNET